MSNDAAHKEIEALQHQIGAMSNTIEALKHRCIDLEFHIVDMMAERIAHDGIHKLEGMLSGQAASQLPDGGHD